jgi:hypothetical protein
MPAGPGDDFSPLDQNSTPFSLSSPTPFDGARFNWLGNPYSSHVNPTFWKLHGWIDDVLVPNWLHANGFLRISQTCTFGDRTCYNWKSRWVGDLGMNQMVAGGAHNHGGGPVGGGAPIGGGSPPTMANGDLDRALRRMLPGASFRTPGLDEAMRGGSSRGGPVGGGAPVGGAGPTAAGPEHHEWDDPRAFVYQFNSCTQPAVPSFLR